MKIQSYTIARSDTGAVLPYAVVTVYLTDGVTKGSIFDGSGTALANPLTADLNGTISFAAPNGTYILRATSADGAFSEPDISVQIFDLEALAQAIGAGALASVVSVKYATKAAMLADLAPAAGAIALVYGDSTVLSNDLYYKIGATGGGSWSGSLGLLAGSSKAYSDLAALWAAGTLPGGAGTKSAKEYAADAYSTYLLTQSVAQSLSSRFRTYKWGGWAFGVWDKAGKVIGGWDYTGTLRSAKARLETLTIGKRLTFNGTNTVSLRAADAVWAVLDKYGRYTARLRRSDGVLEATKAQVSALMVTTINGTPASQLASGFAAPTFASVIEGIIIYGQSLSVGYLGTPPLTTAPVGAALKFSDNTYSAFAPLAESLPVAGGFTQETPAAGTAQMLQDLLATENGLIAGAAGHAYQPFICCPGEGGQMISGLAKGSAPYNRLISQVTTAASLAAAAGKTFRIRSIVWMHGEAEYAFGTVTATYKTQVKQLRTDLDADIRAIIPDNPTINFILSQPASHKNYQYQQEVTGTYPAAIYAKDANIAVALYELARDEPYFTMSCAQYVGDYQSDNVHATNVAYKTFGGYHGRAFKRAFVDGADLKSTFIRPISITKQGKIIEITFSVPRPPLVIDTAMVSAVTGAGFTLRDAGGTDVGALTVDVIEPTKIRIVSPVTVATGFQLRCAIDGTINTTGRTVGPRSTLRDSAGALSNFDPTGINRAMHNMVPIFAYTF